MDSRLGIKLTGLASALKNNFTDEESLKSVFRNVLRTLDDLQSELTSEYRKLATSTDELEHAHASKISEAKESVIEILQNLELYSPFLSKFSRTSIPALHGCFQKFSNAISKQSKWESREQILKFIKNCFKLFTEEIAQLMINNISISSCLQSPKAAISVPSASTLPIKR